MLEKGNLAEENESQKKINDLVEALKDALDKGQLDRIRAITQTLRELREGGNE